MREKDAIKKYGEDTYKKMLTFMGVITVSTTDDGEMDIPERDLEQAYRRVQGKRVSFLEWD